jgi:hypothetical protein
VKRLSSWAHVTALCVLIGSEGAWGEPDSGQEPTVFAAKTELPKQIEFLSLTQPSPVNSNDQSAAAPSESTNETLSASPVVAQEPLSLADTVEAQSQKATATWTKSDIPRINKPAEPPSLLQTIFSFLGTFADDIGAKDAARSSASGLDKIRSDRDEKISLEESYLRSTGTLPAEKGDSSEQRISEYLRSQAGNVAADRLSTGIPFLAAFRNGFSFDLGISKAVSQGTGHKLPRYGLILQEIKTVPTSTNSQGLTDDLDLAYVTESKSEAVWTIGPVGDDESQIYHADYPSFDSIETPSTWDRLTLPSPNMKMKVTPASSNPQELFQGGRPGYVFTATQVQSLYQLSFISRDRNGKSKTSHTFELPIFRSLHLVKVLDQHGKPIRTEANGLLLESNAPSLSLKYYDQDRVYATELSRDTGEESFKFSAERRLGDTSPKAPPQSYRAAFAKKL